MLQPRWLSCSAIQHGGMFAQHKPAAAQSKTDVLHFIHFKSSFMLISCQTGDFSEKIPPQFLFFTTLCKYYGFQKGDLPEVVQYVRVR